MVACNWLYFLDASSRCRSLSSLLLSDSTPLKFRCSGPRSLTTHRWQNRVYFLILSGTSSNYPCQVYSSTRSPFIRCMDHMHVCRPHTADLVMYIWVLFSIYLNVWKSILLRVVNHRHLVCHFHSWRQKVSSHISLEYFHNILSCFLILPFIHRVYITSISHHIRVTLYSL